ncbi:biotin-protein ligase [Lipomyces arxii]|uniref:biotin-protein ligase n=1 Tax=Lipomyces arxii TaxID=56418 RepID=UPI0034CD191E
MNVLVYAGPGTSVESVAQCTATLRSLLSPHYAVLTIDAPTLINEPWPPTTSLLAIPGGADLPYCHALNGEGNAKIVSFVRRGGAFLGFCAGGYYGSSRCEFEENNPDYAVVGPRELSFYPGTDRGTAFAGFVYNSESGARAVKLTVNKAELPEYEESENAKTDYDFRSYYNGGGVFVDADTFKSRNVTVLARYSEQVKVDGGDAAVVLVKVGAGAAILTGPHPEFSPKRLRQTDPNLPVFYKDIIRQLTADSQQRISFLKSILTKLGLKVNMSVTEDTTPQLTSLHLTSAYPEDMKAMWDKIESDEGMLEKDFLGPLNRRLKIVGENDTFIYTEASDSVFDMASMAAQLPSVAPIVDGAPDYNKVPKQVIIYRGDKKVPDVRETPYFDHSLYYQELLPPNSPRQTFGAVLQYAEVVTSTSTMLDKNLSLLRLLPTGFTNLSTIQVSGRGRGGNVWVSPVGMLSFSIVIRHPLAIQTLAPLVFVQYIASLAIVEAIHHYGPGYEELEVRLKWPNDIYARNPDYTAAKAAGKENLPAEYLKIGGVLVNSNYANNEYLLVVGCGVNTMNEAPTTSLNTLLAMLNAQRRQKSVPALMPFALEPLFARVMRMFETMYTVFRKQGFGVFEDLYYSRWLHTDAIVRLDMHGGVRARIKGISLDYGMLLVEEVTFDGESTGKMYTLQPDGNSFDMLKGLLKKKET